MQLFFSVGEPSGDLHASRLITALRERCGDLECTGYGGPLMEAAGCHVDFRLTELAVMGFLEIPPLLSKFWRLYRRAGVLLEHRKPDAVVLVDFPGFNWWIAAAAKRLGIPVIYYLPPQLWAWAPWRIRKMRRLVDHTLCCLPFEYEWYRSRGVSAEYVGHPFFDEVAERPLDRDFQSEAAAKRMKGTRWVGILPGSRNKELRNNFSIQCQAIRRVVEQVPETRFLVAAFKDSQAQWCAEFLQKNASDLPADVHIGRTSEIIETVEACLMVSGSVSLEMLARKTPAVVLYRAHPLFHLFSHVFSTCSYFSLPNLIAGKRVMPEFGPLGRSVRDIDGMAGQLVEWLTRPEARTAKVAELDELCRQVAIPGATASAADAILNRLSIGRIRRAA